MDSEREPAAEQTKRRFLSGRRWRIALGILLGVVALYPLILLFLNRGSEAAVGTYIANGGQTCFEITRGPLGGLHVKRGTFVNMPFGEGTETYSAKFRWGKLHVEQNRTRDEGGNGTLKPVNIQIRFKGSLAPSQLSPQDWDLQESQYNGSMHPSISSRLDGSFDALEWDWESIKDAFSILFGETDSWGLDGEDYLHATLDPSKAPLPSFLHRMDHPLLLLYFQMRRENIAPAECLALLDKISADFPNDPWLMLHQVELEAKTGNSKKAREILAEWEKQHRSHPDPLLHIIAKRAWKNMEYYAWRNTSAIAQYSEIFPFPLPAGFDPAKHLNWQQHEDWFIQRSEYLLPQFMDIPIVMTNERIHKGWNLPVPKFLHFQITAKAGMTRARLALLEGEYEEARNMLTGIYLTGHDLDAQTETLFGILIGIAVRKIACQGIEDYLLNACETESDLLQICDLLARLHEMPGKPGVNDTAIIYLSPLNSLMENSGWGVPDFDETNVRLLFSDTQIALLRLAAHARLYRLQNNRWPESREQEPSDSRMPLIADPFLTTSPLRMKTENADLLVYSVGPDKTDDLASILYDNTNGSRSAGDIFIRIPSERQYPFSPDGIRADNAEDLLRQFPRGLPDDVFSRGFPHPAPFSSYRLSILDSTTTQALTVFSTGPDSDFSFKTASGRVVTWDSSSDLSDILKANPLWQIHDDEVQAVFVPEEAFDAASATTFTAVYQLQPQWDPTNGIKSEGDIFITIPRRNEKQE